MRQGRVLSIALLVLLLLAAEPAGYSAERVGSDEAMGELCLRVVGLTSNDGLISIGLYNSEESYSQGRHSFRKVKLQIRDDRTCEWVLKGIPHGEYAAMLYHDENGNRKLDKNFFGLPKERYGFSNNARPRLGLPPYEAVKFIVRAGATAVDIELQ